MPSKVIETQHGPRGSVEILEVKAGSVSGVFDKLFGGSDTCYKVAGVVYHSLEKARAAARKKAGN